MDSALDLEQWAYQLGGEDVYLQHRVRILWELAQPSEAMPKGVQRLFTTLEDRLRCLGEQLQPAKARRLASRAQQLLGQCWQHLHQTWSGDPHEQGWERCHSSEAEHWSAIWAETAPFQQRPWGDLTQALDQLGQALPVALKRWWQLGRRLSLILWAGPEATSVAGEQHLALTDVQLFLHQLQADHRLSPELVLDPHPAAWVLARAGGRAVPGTDSLVPWAEALHAAVLRHFEAARLTRLQTAAEETWISATEAAEVSERLERGPRLSLGRLSKLAREEPVPFRWRKPCVNRLEIELASFIAFLLRKKDRATGAGELSEQALARRIHEAQATRRASRCLN